MREVCIGINLFGLATLVCGLEVAKVGNVERALDEEGIRVLEVCPWRGRRQFSGLSVISGAIRRSHFFWLLPSSVICLSMSLSCSQPSPLDLTPVRTNRGIFSPQGCKLNEPHFFISVRPQVLYYSNENQTNTLWFKDEIETVFLSVPFYQVVP